MGGKRTLKKKKEYFLIDVKLIIQEKIQSLLNLNKGKKSWQKRLHYESGDKKNFPSWVTTNIVNLKTLKFLGENILSKKSDFIIIDSFQFHSQSIPPTQFASKWLKNLSEYSNFGYIPLYEKLNKSRRYGNSPIWKYDAHLNELGNQIFADAMFDYLKQKLN